MKIEQFFSSDDKHWYQSLFVMEIEIGIQDRIEWSNRWREGVLFRKRDLGTWPH